MGISDHMKFVRWKIIFLNSPANQLSRTKKEKSFKVHWAGESTFLYSSTFVLT